MRVNRMCSRRGTTAYRYPRNLSESSMTYKARNTEPMLYATISTTCNDVVSACCVDWPRTER